MRDFSRIRRALYNQPWAITDHQFDVIAGVIEAAASDFNAGKTMPAREKPKLRYMSGVPVIPIEDTISKKMNLLSDVSGGTSIESLNQQFTEALASDSRAIIFAIDSPGGGIPGVPEFATRVFEARQSGKTIISSIEGLGASAAYWIGVASDEVYASEGSEVGSVGVIARIIDDTRAMKNEGFDPIVIRSSELKAPGVGPMSPAQSNAVQQRVMEFDGMFKGFLGRARPGLDLTVAGNGNTFAAAEALHLGLIDGIATLESLVARYAKR